MKFSKHHDVYSCFKSTTSSHFLQHHIFTFSFLLDEWFRPIVQVSTLFCSFLGVHYCRYTLNLNKGGFKSMHLKINCELYKIYNDKIQKLTFVWFDNEKILFIWIFWNTLYTLCSTYNIRIRVAGLFHLSEFWQRNRSWTGNIFHCCPSSLAASIRLDSFIHPHTPKSYAFI